MVTHSGSMRISAAIVVFGALAAGGSVAHASSLVSLLPLGEPLGSSMVVLGSKEETSTPSITELSAEKNTTVKAAEGWGSVAISSSTVATSEGPIDEERTAAIDVSEQSIPRNPDLGSMVIRGSITGNAFAR